MKRYLLVGFASVILIVVTIALPGRTPSAAQGQASSSTAILGGAVGGVLGGTGPLTPMPSPPQKPAPKLGRVGSNLKAPRPTVPSLRQLNRILLEKSSDEGGIEVRPNLNDAPYILRVADCQTTQPTTQRTHSWIRPK